MPKLRDRPVNTMMMNNNLREAASSLLGAKQRSLLALLGIVVGIGSVIAMISIGKIAQEEALRQFKEIGTDILVVTKRYGDRGGNGARQKMTMENALAIPGRCSAILAVSPYYSTYTNFKFQGEKDDFQAYGVTPEFWGINKLQVKEGRFIHSLDGFMYHCVIGSEIAAKLNRLGLKTLVGEQILYGDRYFNIVGVLEKTSMAPMRPFELNRSVFIHPDVFERMFKDASLEKFMVKISPGVDYQDATSQIVQYYSDLNGLKVDVRSAEELVDQMKKQMQLYTLLLGAIGSISLVVGGIGVMNVMLVSVTERTREIGIRRAIGARRSDIQLQFLIESVLLCIVGGVLGIVTGVLVSYIISRYAQWHFVTSIPSIVLGAGVACFVGIFFGFYPARQAAGLSPITALRSE